MPPRQKFTQEEIVTAALSIISAEGVDVLTARKLAEKLKSSPRPIFTIFPSMEAVLATTIIAAKKLYNDYIMKGLEEKLAFRGVGGAYIKFAKEQPNLFKWLFMSEQEIGDDEIANILKGLDDNNEVILSSLMDEYDLTRDIAQTIYHHLWIYSHGIAVLQVTKIHDFREEEINEMMTQIFKGLLIEAKYRGENHD